MELEYPNRIYPMSDIGRRFLTPRLREVRPLEYTKMVACVFPFSWGRGYLYLRCLSREDFLRKPDNAGGGCKKQWLPIPEI